MLNTEQILEQNGLNWNVVKKPLMYAGECTTEANNGLHQKAMNLHKIIQL